MTPDPTPTPVAPEPLPVRWDAERCGFECGGVFVPVSGLYGLPTIRASLAAALTPPPTPAEIADHIDEWARRKAAGQPVPEHPVEGWNIDQGRWVANGLSAAWFRSRPGADTPAHGCRLVPLPPEPSYEVEEVPRWEARGEVFAEEVGGKYHTIVFVCAVEGGGPTVSLSNGYIARASDGGTVPVRRERKSP